MNFDGKGISTYILLALIPLGVIGETCAISCVLLKNKWNNVDLSLFLGIILLTHFLLTGIWNEYPIWKTLQQIILLMFYFVSYSTFFKKKCYDVDGIWSKYLRICIFFSFLSWIQLFVYWYSGNDIFLWPGRNFTGNGYFLRLHSYFEEPGYYAAFLAPYIVYYVQNIKCLKENKINFLSVLLTFMLSMSSISFVIILMTILYKVYKSKYSKLIFLFFTIPIIFELENYLNNSAEFQKESSSFQQSVSKITESVSSFSDFNPASFELLNASTYATMTNLWVAVNAPNRILGNGVGSHVHSYETLYKSDYVFYGLNKADAFSLFTRLFSEFGILGLLGFACFLLYFFNGRSYINVAAFFFIIACLIRGGHYTYNGCFFFFFVFVISSSRIKRINGVREKYLNNDC